MTLSIQFNETNVKLYGEVVFKLLGEVRCSQGITELITGLNGNGKTLLLSSIAFLFKYPAFGAVRDVDRKGVKIESAKIIRKVVPVRQNSIDNFAGRYLADEFRLVYADSLFDVKTFESEMKELLSNGLDIRSEMLSRPVKTLSSGERQMLAVCLALLVRADLILLDEPLARLSKKYAIRILQLIEQKASEQYILMTFHNNDTQQLDLRHSRAKLVEKKQNLISINDIELVTDTNQATISDADLESMFIDTKSYYAEKTWSRDFDELPTRNVRCISGNGAVLIKEEVDIDIQLNNSILTSAKGFIINQGINLLYGDNGAGKTLIARCLAGEFKINPILRILRPLFAIGKAPSFDTSLIEDMPPTANIKWLRNNIHSFYLPSEPECIIAENTVGAEIAGVCLQNEIEERLVALEKLNIFRDMNRSELSYGQAKMLAFYTLPKKLALVILDEPFANLSEQYQSEVSALIFSRLKSRNWYSVILTTNRPMDTVNALKLV